jgi:hypothetical protein
VRVARDGETIMAVEALSSVRAASDMRETQRQDAQQYALKQADLRRDTRVEDAKAAEDARLRSQDRKAEKHEHRKRSRSNAKVVDVLA